MQSLQQKPSKSLEKPERYEPSDAFIEILEKLEKEVESQDEYFRRQLEAVFQQR